MNLQSVVKLIKITGKSPKKLKFPATPKPPNPQKIQARKIKATHPTPKCMLSMFPIIETFMFRY
jgi:hypothetical protein